MNLFRDWAESKQNHEITKVFMAGILYIISAPSGSGKSTLVNELRSIVPNLDFSISYTTRPPRGSEQNGREYYFVTRDEFEKMLAEDRFLEHAEVFGNYYGTACRFLDEIALKPDYWRERVRQVITAKSRGLGGSRDAERAAQ